MPHAINPPHPFSEEDLQNLMSVGLQACTAAPINDFTDVSDVDIDRNNPWHPWFLASDAKPNDKERVLVYNINPYYVNAGIDVAWYDHETKTWCKDGDGSILEIRVTHWTPLTVDKPRLQPSIKVTINPHSENAIQYDY